MSENNDLITCSHCGSQNPSTFRFCSNCGERLNEKKEEAPVQETSFSEDAVQTPVQDPSAAWGAETEQPSAETSAFAKAEGDSSKFYDFAGFVYERQEHFYNAQFLHKTHEDLRQFVADLAQEHSGIDRESFLNRMGDKDISIDARTPIRYAATKAVWATPTFFVNNADKVPVDHNSSVSEWQALIDPLLEI